MVQIKNKNIAGIVALDTLLFTLSQFELLTEKQFLTVKVVIAVLLIYLAVSGGHV